MEQKTQHTRAVT